MATGVLTVQPHYEPDFDRVWHEIMAQQIDHRLAGYYVADTVVGVSKRYSQMGSQSYAMSQKTARAAWTEPSCHHDHVSSVAKGMKGAKSRKSAESARSSARRAEAAPLPSEYARTFTSST